MEIRYVLVNHVLLLLTGVSPFGLGYYLEG